MTIANFLFLDFFEICLLLLAVHYRLLPIVLSLVVYRLYQNHIKTVQSLPSWLVILCVWILLSCCWSPNVYAAFFKAVPSVLILIMGVLGYKHCSFSYNDKRLMTFFAFVIIWITVEYYTKASLRQYAGKFFLGRPMDLNFNISFYNRAITGLSILFWPIWSLIVHPIKKWIFLGFFLVFVIASPSETSAISFIIGFLGYIFIKNYYMVKILFWGIQMTLFLSFPAVTLLKYLENFFSLTLPYSLIHRFRIWEYFQQNIAQKMITGWGMDAAHILSKQQLFVGHFEVSALHPHNAVLQIWFELGGIGIMITSLFFTALFNALKQVPLDQSRFIYAQIITTFVMSLSAFGLWQGWWLSLLWIAAYLTKAVLIQPSK